MVKLELVKFESTPVQATEAPEGSMWKLEVCLAFAQHRRRVDLERWMFRGGWVPPVDR